MLLNYRNIRNSGNINIGIPVFEALLETYPVQSNVLSITTVKYTKPISHIMSFSKKKSSRRLFFFENDMTSVSDC